MPLPMSSITSLSPQSIFITSATGAPTPNPPRQLSAIIAISCSAYYEMRPAVQHDYNAPLHAKINTLQILHIPHAYHNSIIQLFLSSPKPILKFSATQTLATLALMHSAAMASCSVNLENPTTVMCPPTPNTINSSITQSPALNRTPLVLPALNPPSQPQPNLSDLLTNYNAHTLSNKAPDALVAHEQTILLYDHKYGMTVEMFPNSELLIKKCPNSPTPFNSADYYKMAATQESAFLDELFTHFPEHIHETVMRSKYFKDLVNKCIIDAHSNEIKKLHGVAGDIFKLPGKYFANASFDRAAIVNIQKMFGVSGKTQTYKIFLPLLFPSLQEDPTLKTIFGNWTLFAKILRASLYGITLLHQEPCGRSKTNAQKWSLQQVMPGSIAWAVVIVIFLLSPDTEFPGSGVGKLSTINYKDLFFNIRIFGAAKLSTSMDPAGAKDFSEEINHAMLALDMDTDSKEDTPVTPPVLSTLSLSPSAVSALPAPSLAPEGSNLITQPVPHPDESVSRAAIHANNSYTSVNAVANNVDDSEADGDRMESGGGQAKTKSTRGKKVVAQGHTHRGCSRKV
ncbi:hypothetical protein BD769DRAFT_1670481 [Suillus cothurnatus]|nr:hypothetical protein BD769DRAFT_1670481 [Suillus cothurnatus]